MPVSMKKILEAIAVWATLVVGLATLALVWVTRDVAEQTRALARADVRPVLADVPLGAPGRTIIYDHMAFPLTVKLHDGAAIDARAFQQAHGGDVGAARSIAVRNIGKGPAVVEHVELKAIGMPRGEHVKGWSSPSTIPAGETGRLMSLELTGQAMGATDLSVFDQDVRNTYGFTIAAEYADIEGNQRQIATARVEANYNGGLHLAAFTVRDE
jgi:hypothetical protein